MKQITIMKTLNKREVLNAKPKTVLMELKLMH